MILLTDDNCFSIKYKYYNNIIYYFIENKKVKELELLIEFLDENMLYTIIKKNIQELKSIVYNCYNRYYSDKYDKEYEICYCSDETKKINFKNEFNNYFSKN